MGGNGEKEAEGDTEVPGLVVVISRTGDRRRKVYWRKMMGLGLEAPSLR